MKNIWGIDLGGTKIECAVLNSENHEVISRNRVPTESANGYEHVLSQIKKLVELSSSEINEKPGEIGMGTPGSIDPITGYLKNSNSTILNEKPFKIDIQNVLGIPVEIANDANCFALAETLMGVVPEQCPDARVVFGVIMGTGVGGGLVVNGQVWNGKHGIGGEWGHIYLDESGGSCYCGKSGCVETIISGSSLERYYFEESGNSKKLKEITLDHLNGSDSYSTKTIQRLLYFFGLGLSNIINIIDPDVIVIGGGVGNLELLYSNGPEEVEKHVFNNSFSTPILKPTLGDSAGVYGAAFLTQS